MANPHGAAWPNCCDNFLARFNSFFRQPVQKLMFLQVALLATGVELIEQPLKKTLIIGPAGKIMAASQQQRHPEFPPEAFEKCRTLPLRAPVIITVGVDKPSEAKVLEIENVCAAAAAIQNLLLAASAMGLGAKWRTAEWARDPMVKEFLGFQPDQHLIGFIYIGYHEILTGAPPRPSFEDRTAWIE